VPRQGTGVISMKAKFLLGVGALFGVAAIPISTNAEDAKQISNTIQELYQQCKSDKGPDRVLCLGFIAGSVAQMEFIATAAEKMDTPGDRLFLLAATKFCSGETSSLGAMRQAFINWAEKHPEAWSMFNGYGVNAALHETWPCR
jgi:hypothetical protein